MNEKNGEANRPKLNTSEISEIKKQKINTDSYLRFLFVCVCDLAVPNWHQREIVDTNVANVFFGFTRLLRNQPSDLGALDERNLVEASGDCQLSFLAVFAVCRQSDGRVGQANSSRPKCQQQISNAKIIWKN